MKLVRLCVAMLATLTFASAVAGQCGPARPKDPTGGGSLDDMIVAQEKLIIEAIKKKDAAAFKSLVDETGTLVDSRGIRKTSDVLSELFAEGVSFSEWTLEDPRVKLIDKNTAVLTYKSSLTMTANGQTMSGKSFETTVYVRRAGKWVGWLHQSSEMAKSETEVTPAK